MSYPATMMWGTGYPVFTLITQEWVMQGRRIVRSVVNKTIAMPHISNIEIGFSPERMDGGNTIVRLSNGEIVSRAEGFRVEISLTWVVLDSDESQNIAAIFNQALYGDIILQPHNDVPVKYRVIPDGEFKPSLTGDMYLGMQVTAKFIGVEVLSAIPTYSSESQSEYFALVW